MHYRRADDDYVGSSSIGGIRLKPGIAKGNVCRFRDHVVAEIAGGILKETRSEEHTSELQSLMRISYAVFCLKKKKNYKQNIESITMSKTSHLYYSIT